MFPVFLFFGALCALLIILGIALHVSYYTVNEKKHEEIERARKVWFGEIGVVPMVFVVASLGAVALGMLILRESSNHWLMLIRQKLQEILNNVSPSGNDIKFVN
jgi:cytochrome bd-type quinol oxidase subunit 2